MASWQQNRSGPHHNYGEGGKRFSCSGALLPSVGCLLQFSADVLACNLRPDGNVEVLDTWNLEERRGNVRDQVDDTLLFSSSIEDGRISCL